METKPIIGITCDWEESGSFSKRPYYALRTHYFNAVIKAGGLPIAIPLNLNEIDAYIGLIDGLIIPGGHFSSPKQWYVDDVEENTPSPRSEVDLIFIRKVIAAKKPILGICAGMQEMAVAFGGKMHNKISASFDTDIDHLNGAPAEEETHKITITEGSHLQKIIGTCHASVNSAHSEAIAQLPPSFIASAHAPDGIIEAIEYQNADQFILGVQWHPEFLVNNYDMAIMSALVEAAAKVK